MISIIVCSKDAYLLKQVSASIAATVGVPYEIIPIENSRGKLGICEAYNMGASGSKYNLLCFMHEDILFHSQDWGRLVATVLEDQAVGLIGLAGGTAKPQAPGPWRLPDDTYSRVNILQGFPDQHSQHLYINPLNEAISNVVTLDGVWLCCRKEVWEKCRFDAVTFSGFHFYDIDFSFNVHQSGYRVCVVYNILLEHFSPGNPNQTWIENAVLFARKWQRFLPVSIRPLKLAIWKKLEVDSYNFLLRVMLHNNYQGKHFAESAFKYAFPEASIFLDKRYLKLTMQNRFPLLFQYLRKLYRIF